MEWINKNDRMPENHPEFEDCTKSVMVTDGENWGYGNYDYSMKRWTYHLVGCNESDDNDITHWAEPPVLPSNIEVAYCNCIKPEKYIDYSLDAMMCKICHKPINSKLGGVIKSVCPVCGDELLQQVNSTNLNCVRCGETVKQTGCSLISVRV